MKYLLDTHTFLWAYGQSNRLPKTVKATIEDSTSEVFVSAVTFWEIVSSCAQKDWISVARLLQI